MAKIRKIRISEWPRSVKKGSQDDQSQQGPNLRVAKIRTISISGQYDQNLRIVKVSKVRISGYHGEDHGVSNSPRTVIFICFIKLRFFSSYYESQFFSNVKMLYFLERCPAPGF